MPIFHDAALRAAAGEAQDLSWLRPEHLADWRGLAVALDRLSPEQRSAAVYADRRRQINRTRSKTPSV